MLAILAGFSVAGDLRHPEWWDPAYGLREHLIEEAIRKQPEKELLLFLGTSRTADGICSKKFDRMPSLLAFNFGVPGALPIHQLTTLKRLIKQNVRPAYVLVEILPACLGNADYPDKMLPPSCLRMSEIDLIEDHLASPGRYRLNWLLSRIESISNARFGLMNGLARWAIDDAARNNYAQNEPSHPLGWFALRKENFNNSYRESMINSTRDTYRPAVASMTWCEDPKRCTDEIIELCQREGIPVALYLMPESGVFRSWYGPASLALLEQFSEYVNRKYRIRLLDFRQECADDDFVDGHHIWSDRAPVVTQRLMDRHILPWVAEQRQRR